MAREHLTDHFTLDEMTRTTVRQYQRENYKYGAKHRAQLVQLARYMEGVRELLGDLPLIVHSGIRCPNLNRWIGGSNSSQHMKGEAVDFHVAGMDLEIAFQVIWAAGKRGDLHFGQLLLEDGDADGTYSWIHLSLGHPWRPLERCEEVALVTGNKFTWLQRSHS